MRAVAPIACVGTLPAGGTFCHPCWRPFMRGGTFRRLRERPTRADAYPREGLLLSPVRVPYRMGRHLFVPQMGAQPCGVAYSVASVGAHLRAGSVYLLCGWRVPSQAGRRILSPLWVPHCAGRHILLPVLATIHAGRQILSPVWALIRAGLF